MKHDRGPRTSKLFWVDVEKETGANRLEASAFDWIRAVNPVWNPDLIH